MKKVIQIINYNFLTIFIFEVIYRFTFSNIFIPVIKRVIDFTFLINNEKYLLNYNILSYLSKPLILVCFLFIIFLITYFIMIEINGIIKILATSAYGLKIGVLEIIIYTIKKSLSVFKRRNWIIIILVLIVLPFTHIVEISSFFNYLKVPDFILESFTKNFYFPYCIFIGYIIVVFLIFKILPSFCFYSLENIDFITSIKRSWKSSRKSFLRYVFNGIFYVVIYNLIFLIFGILVVYLIISISLINIKAYYFAISIFEIIILLYKIFSVPFLFSIILIYYFKIGGNYYVIEEKIGFQKINTNKRKYFLVDFFGAVVICFLFLFVLNFLKLENVGNLNKNILVMAHRGNSNMAPENTIPAFKSCIDNGILSAELDVQMTRDGQIVVLHDQNLSRTTGYHRNIWDVNYSDIEKLDNGSFFDSKFKNTKIPTLEDVIELSKEKLILNIEIKRNNHDNGIEEKVIEIISKHNFFDECYVSSLDISVLKKIKSIDSRIRTIYTTNLLFGDISELIYIDAFSVESSFVDENVVNIINENDKELFVWTVDNESDMQKMIDLEVDAIITDNPIKLKELIIIEMQPDFYGEIFLIIKEIIDFSQEV